MVVVVIIGLFAALAVPSIVSVARDQRVRRESQKIQNVFREARARSLGRGSAVNVNFLLTAAGIGSRADFVTREAITSNLPDPMCRGYNWANGVQIGHYYPPLTNGDPLVRVTAVVDNAALGAPTPSNYVDVCYTPKGRLFTRNAAVAQYNFMAGRVTFNAQRMDGDTVLAPVGLIRSVLVNDDGTTRLRL